MLGVLQRRVACTRRGLHQPLLVSRGPRILVRGGIADATSAAARDLTRGVSPNSPDWGMPTHKRHAPRTSLRSQAQLSCPPSPRYAHIRAACTHAWENSRTGYETEHRSTSARDVRFD